LIVFSNFHTDLAGVFVAFDFDVARRSLDVEDFLFPFATDERASGGRDAGYHQARSEPRT
jgi:hypothetical protein